MSATYSTTQMIYTFTFSANSAAGLSFDNSNGGGLAALQTYTTTVEGAVLADTTIQGLIGADWAPVWGPVVFAEDTSGPTVHADNTMGCYYSPSNNMFVIAVAGTNPSSPFDWLDEDLTVHTMVPWTSAGGTSSGNISTGANTGLQILLGMEDASGTKMLSALSAYISSQKVNNAVVAVTGHSLAGALSPCLALYMYQNSAAWDPNGNQTMAAYPTAGPTPGDITFASNYDTLITNNSIAYASVYNTLDVVPLAWALTDIETIPAIYDANITPIEGASPKDLFMGLVGCALQLNACSTSFLGLPVNPYTQVSTNRSSLAGTFDTTVDSGVSKELKHVGLALGTLSTYAPYLTNVARFAAQAVYQHTVAYPTLLSITKFDTEYQTILQNNKPSSATQVDGVRATVKNLTGVDLMKFAGIRPPKSAA